MTPSEIEGKNILVPLCGKTVDMMYLAQYANKVIGVELVEEKDKYIVADIFHAANTQPIQKFGFNQ